MFQVKALDFDEGINSDIQYSIYSKNDIILNNLFGINAVTGAISLLDDAGSWGAYV